MSSRNVSASLLCSRSVIIRSVTFDAVDYHNNDSLVTTVHNPFSLAVHDVCYGRPTE